MRKAGRAPAPDGACDCHLHVFGPRARYAYAAERAYTPPDATLAQYRRTMRRLGLSRGVLVQPSVYGAGNRAMLAALGRAGPDFRAVAVIDAAASERDLARLHDAGVRGVRLNMLSGGAGAGGDWAGEAAALAERIAPLGWHLQLLTDVSRFPDLARRVDRLPVDLVFDHLGHMPAALGRGHPGFRDLLALLRGGRAWVKLSAAYRLSSDGRAPYPDVRPLAEAILEAAPGRALWGSDWPHPAFAGSMPDAAELLGLFLDWAGDDGLARRVLVDNPARLYGFSAPAGTDGPSS